MTDDKKPDVTALATQNRSWTLLPNSLGEALEIANIIAKSEFAPRDYKGKPESVLLAVQMGADLGLKPLQSLQNIAVINGRPSIFGDAALALVQARGVLERLHETFEGEGDTLTAVCILKRKGFPDEIRRTFSVADARAAGLWGKAGPWTTYPKRMLQMRARGFGLRDTAPDLLMGLVLAEEAMDYPDIEVTATSVEDVPKPSDAFDRLPEALRDNIEKACAALNMAPGLRLAKINEYLGVADSVPEEQAEKLLEWCRDEFAKRKTGLPRVKKTDNGKRTNAPTPKQEGGGEPAPAKSGAAAGGTTGPVPAPPTETVTEGEVVPMTAADVPFASQGEPTQGEIF